MAPEGPWIDLTGRVQFSSRWPTDTGRSDSITILIKELNRRYGMRDEGIADRFPVGTQVRLRVVFGMIGRVGDKGLITWEPTEETLLHL